MRDVMHLTSR